MLMRYLDNLQGAFAYGIIDDLVYLSAYGLQHGWGATMQQLGEIAQGVVQFFQGKRPTGLIRQLRNIPFVGRGLYEGTKPPKRKGRRARRSR